MNSLEMVISLMFLIGSYKKNMVLIIVSCPKEHCNKTIYFCAIEIQNTFINTIRRVIVIHGWLVNFADVPFLT